MISKNQEQFRERTPARSQKRIRGLQFLLLSLSCLGILSCKPDTSGGDLKLVVGPSTANALPVSISSCKQGGSTDSPGLAAPAYEFTKFKYSWLGDKDFTMSYIQVTLKSGFLQGGKDTCTISASDLLATLGSAERQIKAGDTTERTAACSIRCGSLKLVDGVTDAYLTGTLRVIGIETDPEGDSSPVVGESDIAVQYKKP